MTNTPLDLLCDPSGELSARFLQDPENLYGLHGTSTLPPASSDIRWLPMTGRRYASLKGVVIPDAEPRPDDGLLPPIEPEIARWIGEKVGALYRAAAGRLANPVDDLGVVTK